MMDSYITGRGSSIGTSYTYLTTVTSTSYQTYTIDNIDQYTALALYLLYPGNKVIVTELTIPIELFKTTGSTNCVQAYYSDGSIHCGRIYYSSSNAIFGFINNADSMQVYGIK